MLDKKYTPPLHLSAPEAQRAFETTATKKAHGIEASQSRALEREFHHTALRVTSPTLRRELLPLEDCVHRPARVQDDTPLVLLAAPKLDNYVKGRRSGALRLNLLEAATTVLSAFLCRRRVPQRGALHAANEASYLLVFYELPEVTVRRGDHPHPSLLARPSSFHLRRAPDFVDHHNLGRVVLDALNHDPRLGIQRRNHHPPSKADAGVWHVAIPCDFVARVNDADVALHGEQPCRFAHDGRLPAPRLAKEQDAAVIAKQQVRDHVCVAADVPADPHRKADNIAVAVSHA
mmetsp:Transcript_5330/g.6608  ORF Transcript_5330/g.6608 Transcript_5330/m.6608 type:complete len:290 (+) Transcript_5330:430-1299(+)